MSWEDSWETWDINLSGDINFEIPESENVNELVSSLGMTNASNEYYSIKLKCNWNDLFRIEKSGIYTIAPWDQISIRVWFNLRRERKPENGKYFFRVLYITYGRGTTAEMIEKSWADYEKNKMGGKRVNITFKYPEKKRAKLMDKKDVKQDKEGVMTDKKKYEEIKLELKRKKEKEAAEKKRLEKKK